MSAFGSSLFGNKPAGNNLFGSTSTSTQQPAQPGGLFGSTTNANTNTGVPQGGNLFGNTQPQNQQSGTPGVGAGTGTLGGGLFGASNNQQQNQGQPGTTGGSLFGNASTGTNANGATGGGLFGNSNAGGGGTTTGGGLFGNTSTNQPATGGGLFGSTTNATNNQQQPATGNLFGASTSNQSSGGLFGNKAAAGTSGGGLFGSTNTTAPGGGIATPSLFGQSNQQQPSNSLFGNQTQQQPSSLFGGVSQQPQQQPQQSSSLGSSLLGSSLLGKSTLPGLAGLGASTANTNGLFSSRLPTTATAGQREQDAQSQFLNLQQRIEGIVEAWNPQSPSNRFQHYFYNFVLPEEVQLYGRPANATNEELWQKAVRENPDPSCLVPVLATSFDDLHARVQGQVERSAQHTKALTELQSRISQLSSAHALSTSPRLNKAIAAQTQLTHRLLKLVTHLHLLIPALRSSAIRPEEEALRGALEEMEGEVLSRRGGANAAGGMGRLVARLNEMWALIGALNAIKSGNEEQGVSWAVVDEDGLNQIVQILAEEQAGLAHLTKILQKDIKDVAVIYGEDDARLDESASLPQEGTELMSSFSQTLRASSLR